MALTDPPPALPTGAADAPTAAPPKLRRMSFGLLLVYVAILAVNSGGNGILLPNIVAGLDEASKIGNLAIVTTVAFIANIFAQPLAGALSDATRSRFGRRTPWMVGGALLTSGFLIGLPMAQSVLTVAIVWLVVQVGVNAIQAAATALVPDRYPAARRGGVSAMIGVGITIGNAVGAIVAGSTASRGMLPYAVLAALVLVIIGGFVLVNREEPSTHLPRAAGAAPRSSFAASGSTPASTPTSPGRSGRASSWSSASTAPRPTACTSCATTSASATPSPTPSPRRWASSSSSASSSRRSSAAGSPTASAVASRSSSGPRSSCPSRSPSRWSYRRPRASSPTRSSSASASAPTSPSTSP